MIYLLVSRVNRSGVQGKVRAQQAQQIVVAPGTEHLPMPGVVTKEADLSEHDR